MRRFASLNLQNRIRWIFIFGVLAGLFFSGGEGIQLLPFPATKNNNAENAFFVLEKNPKSYAFSVHNSGNLSPLVKSKYQKHTNKSVSGGHLNFDWSHNPANFCLQSAHICEEAALADTSLSLSSQSDRAPPTV